MSTLESWTNYSLINTHNIYNLIITTLELIHDDQKAIFINNIKMLMGLWFYNNFKEYFVRKFPDSPNMKWFV